MCNVFCPFSAVEYHYNRAMIKRTLQIASFHLTRLFELRKSCWELCDSQSVWKSQFSDVFVRNPLVLAKQHVVCDKTTRCSCDFKGHFSDYVPRNLFFFPRNFENVRRNQEKIRQNLRRIGENQEKIWAYREKQRIVFSRMHHNLVKSCLPF